MTSFGSVDVIFLSVEYLICQRCTSSLASFPVPCSGFHRLQGDGKLGVGLATRLPHHLLASSPVPRPAFHRLQYDKSRAASDEKLGGGTGNEANRPPIICKQDNSCLPPYVIAQ